MFNVHDIINVTLPHNALHISIVEYNTYYYSVNFDVPVLLDLALELQCVAL